MERIILEVQARGLNQYHVIDKFPITIGRAFDNDIILSDRSVSAHHIRIEQGEYGNLYVHNLSDENGTSIDGHRIDNEPAEIKLAELLTLGHIKLRLVSPSVTVEETHRHDCDNLFCALGKPLWSGLLLLLTVAMIFLEQYIGTSSQKDMLYYFTQVFPSLLTIVLVTSVFSLISRIAVQRWHVLSIMSIVSLLLILFPQLLIHAGHYLNYFFTSDTPQEMLINVSQYVLPLVLIFFFMRTIYRAAMPLALGVALTISFFFALPHILDSVDELSIEDDFSDTPNYNRTLSYLDRRLEKTITVDEFIDDSKEKLQKQMDKELEFDESE